MSAAPSDIDASAWRAVMQEDIPNAGTESRPLLRPVRDSVADDMRCTWPGCGDALAGSGAGRGWVLVRIVGSGDPPRRYHSGSCASRGIAHVELGNHRATPTPIAAPTPIGAPLVAGSKGAGARALADRLASLGTTSKAVKTWAVEQGLLPEIVRGSVPARLIDAWEAANGSGS